MRTAEAALGRLVETGEWLQAVIRPGAFARTARAGRRRSGCGCCTRACAPGSGPPGAGTPRPGARRSMSPTRRSRCSSSPWMPLRILQRLGFTLHRARGRGVYALWRFVGHLLGIPPELNPDGEARGRAIARAARAHRRPSRLATRASSSGRCSKATCRPTGPRRACAGRFLAAVDRAMAIANLPPGYPEALGIQPSPVRHVLRGRPRGLSARGGGPAPGSGARRVARRAATGS